MTDKYGSQNFRENDPPGGTLRPTSDITLCRMQQIQQVRIPQSLIEWLALHQATVAPLPGCVYFQRDRAYLRRNRLEIFCISIKI